jgi:hypothetical protein
MNTKLVVLRNGKPLFEYPIDLNADVGLAVGATMALSEFHRLNPTISLLDPEISIRFKNSSEVHNPWLRGRKFRKRPGIAPDQCLTRILGQFQGNRSSSRLIGWPSVMRCRISLR